MDAAAAVGLTVRPRLYRSRLRAVYAGGCLVLAHDLTPDLARWLLAEGIGHHVVHPADARAEVGLPSGAGLHRGAGGWLDPDAAAFAVTLFFGEQGGQRMLDLGRSMLAMATEAQVPVFGIAAAARALGVAERWLAV